MRFRPAWFLSNTYCWINCSPEWDILTFHSLSSRCRYRRMTCDIPHSLQRRPPHCCRNHWKDSSTSSQTWPRPRALRTVSNRPIFSPSSSSSTLFDLSSAHTNTCSLSLFFFFPCSYFSLLSSLSVGSFGLYKVDCNWSRCEKTVPPCRKQSSQQDRFSDKENEQSRRKIKHFACKRFFCQARRSFTSKPLQRGNGYCSLIGRSGKVMKSVRERK